MIEEGYYVSLKEYFLNDCSERYTHFGSNEIFRVIKLEFERL